MKYVILILLSAVCAFGSEYITIPVLGTGSMQPIFPKGETDDQIVGYAKIKRATMDEIVDGLIVVFEYKGRWIIHKVKKVERGYFITYGISNKYRDPGFLQSKDKKLIGYAVHMWQI